jgi:hypothetical protein
MFLTINRSETQTILVTATEGRGILEEARIVFQHLVSNQEVELIKGNISTHRTRFDEFQVAAGDLDDLPEGDFIYKVYASDSETNEGLDPDDALETGRGKILTTFVTTEVVHEHNTEAIIYERS